MSSPSEYPGIVLVGSTAVHTKMLRSTGSWIDPAIRLFFAGYLGMMSS
jgi:hypothetical protein